MGCCYSGFLGKPVLCINALGLSAWLILIYLEPICLFQSHLQRVRCPKENYLYVTWIQVPGHRKAPRASSLLIRHQRFYEREWVISSLQQELDPQPPDFIVPGCSCPCFLPLSSFGTWRWHWSPAKLAPLRGSSSPGSYYCPKSNSRDLILGWKLKLETETLESAKGKTVTT